MNKPILLIMVGNIGSGKSTLAKEYVKKGYIIISRDALRYMIGGGSYKFDIKLEPFIKESAVSILTTFLKSGVNLIYDETNVSKSLRKQTIKLAKNYGYKVIAVTLPKLSKQQSVDRRMTNPHGQFDRNIWNTVWENFNNLYEIPEKSEGIDKILRIKGQ